MFNYTISMYYKIIGSETYNYDDGYTVMSIDFFSTVINVDLEDMVKQEREGLADFHNVPVENVILISRNEYEENTERELEV